MCTQHRAVWRAGAAAVLRHLIAPAVSLQDFNRPSATARSPIRVLSLIHYSIFAFFWPLSGTPAWYGLTALGMFMLIVAYSEPALRADRAWRAVSLLAAALFVSATVTMLHHGDRMNLEVLNPVACVGLLYAYCHVDRQYVRGFLYAWLGWLLLTMISKVDIDDSFILIGQNGAMLHLLILYVGYLFAFAYRRPATASRAFVIENFCIVSLQFTLAVWSQSRAATIVASLLLCLGAWLLFTRVGRVGKVLTVFATLAVYGANYSVPPSMGERAYSGIDRVALAGVSDVRYSVWRDYYQTMDVKDLFLGNRQTNCHLILKGYTEKWCNIHNSYLRAHQVYGLIGVLAVSMAMIFAFRKFIQTRDGFIAIVLLMLLIRVMSDEHLFTTASLFMIYFVLLKAMKTPVNSR